MLVAIKRLSPDNRDEFDNEVNSLNRLNKPESLNIVKLILTMEITKRDGCHFYLMFPLADGNLREFWERSDLGDVTTRPQWVALQCHGLARALNMLHNLRNTDKAATANDPFYGIHGDIKPENLLLFANLEADPHRTHGLGVIKLADFGISSIHHTGTRSCVQMDKATKTYRPPEAELLREPSGSRSFDIWSLGCVFLEFLTWLVKGRESIIRKEFSNARQEPFRKRGEEIISDTFYQIVPRKGSEEAEVNPAVNDVGASLI
jgi:serine/threonine protein kinase